MCALLAFRVKLDALSHTNQSPYGDHVVILHNRLNNALQRIPLKHGICIDT